MHNPAGMRLLATAALTAGLTACADPARDNHQKAPLLASIDRGVSWISTVRLEENPDVINVSPRVQAEPGSFLVADGQEQQARLYGHDGRLLRQFGRRGSGPGEFEHISLGLRLPDKRILIADMNGAVTVFDSTATNVQHVARTPLSPLYGAVVLDDSLLILTGRMTSGSTALAHVWNVRSDRLVRSFFTPPKPRPEMEGAYAFSGFANAAVRGDTVAMLFALSDTIYLFRGDGRSVGKLPIPFHSFRRIEKPVPRGTMDDFKRWSESFSAASSIFWLSDGGFLVQYWDRRNGAPSWRLTRLTRKGVGVWEVIDSPQLLAVGPADTLVFVKPGAEAPNVWSIARLSLRQ